MEVVNAKGVEAILSAVSVPVQLGGGIRSLKDVERWIEAGVLSSLITSRHTAAVTSLDVRPAADNLRLDVDGGSGTIGRSLV